MSPPVPPGDKDYPDDKFKSCKTGECPSSQPASHGRATFLTALIVAGAVLGFFILCFSIFLFVRRRRQQRRRREALHEAAALAPAGPAATPDGGGPDLELEEAEQPGGEVVHHAWHIRTVGLDEAAIESIALTRYRAGAGASDCAVCLGEFADGELLRLLPRCAHAFHVSCIDTWLRAHVNCPLCRSHVLEEDPPAAAAAEQTDSPAGQAANDMDTTDRQASDRHELRLQIDQHDHDGQSTSPERPHRNPGPRGGSFSFRRAVSMDSPSPAMASAEGTLPEDGQAGGEKQETGRAVHSSPGAKNRHGIMKRSMSVGSRWALVSWHGSSRSSSFLPR